MRFKDDFGHSVLAIFQVQFTPSLAGECGEVKLRVLGYGQEGGHQATRH
jgi:hypothetical protein